MLFYLNQFELHLQENLLKKGFLLFQNGQVNKLELPGKFVVKGHELTLQIKNNQLQSFSCQCQKSQYCEHLAASLFFIQQQKLHLNAEIYATPKTKVKSTTPNNQLNNIQQIIFKASLVDFSNNEQSKKNKKPQSINYFEPLLNLFRSNLKAFNAKMPLSQIQIDELNYVLNHAAQLIHINEQKQLNFDFQLAVLSFFIYLDDFRFAGDATVLMKLQSDAENKLDQLYKKGLDAKQKQSWLKATVFSIQSNKNIRNKACHFLVPRYLLVSNKQNELKKIEDTLKKRIYKKPYDEALNKIEIVKQHLHFKIYGLPKKINFNTDEMIEPEFLMALCEVYFLKNKVVKALELIDGIIQHYLAKNSIHLRTFTFYAIERSRYFNLVENETKYLRLSFIYNFNINDDEINRFKKLIKKANWHEELNSLIDKIKISKTPFSFEKLTKLLLLTENYPELIKILSQEKNKFKLFHDTILKMPTALDLKLMKVYAGQLGSALQEATTFISQKQLISRCRQLTEKLEENEINQLLQLIINETGYESQIGKFILEEFEGLMVSE